MSASNGALTKDQILKADDRKVAYVDCPEWGGRVYVRPLSGEQRDELEEKTLNAESSVGIRAWLAACGMCDSEGKALEFTPREVDMLGGKSAAALSRVALKIQDISGMTAEAVEELEGNSGSDQSEDSGSA